MSTRLEIDHDRLLGDAELQAIVARRAASLNVLQQVGATYQSLPGLAMADLQTRGDALEAKLTALTALMGQAKTLVQELDALGVPADEENKALLRALQGVLAGKAEFTLLTQITGPTAQGGGTTPPPGGPTPP